MIGTNFAVPYPNRHDKNPTAISMPTPIKAWDAAGAEYWRYNPAVTVLKALLLGSVTGMNGGSELRTAFHTSIVLLLTRYDNMRVIWSVLTS